MKRYGYVVQYECDEEGCDAKRLFIGVDEDKQTAMDGWQEIKSSAGFVSEILCPEHWRPNDERS